MTRLQHAIQANTDQEMSANELSESARNLIGFMRVLMEINAEHRIVDGVAAGAYAPSNRTHN